MKKITNLLLICVLSLAARYVHAQTYNPQDYNDVRINWVNREDARAITLPESRYQQYLSGTWKFNWARDPENAPKNFWDWNYNVSGWEDVPVPMTWQVYAYQHNKDWDKPLYSNTQYPFTYTNDFKVQVYPNDWNTYGNNLKNPVGSYRREFQVPADWNGRDVFVRFNGAGHGYYVWVNGKYIGYAEDSYLPSDFKLDNLNYGGNNMIAVQVYRFTSGSLIEDQDYWRLTGITRDVLLWTVPKTHIKDYFFRTYDLWNNNSEAKGKVWVEMNQPQDGYWAKVTVSDGGANKVEQYHTFRGNEKSVDIEWNTKENIEAWSAERPKLYDLNVEIYDSQNNLIDKRTQKVGFRTVKLSDKGELLINNKSVIIHGVNRHTFSETGGRTITKEEVEEEIKLMKKLNINAVRTSHYPNNPYFYELANEYGLYILSEANVECHGNGSLSGNQAFRYAMSLRSERMVKYLRNFTNIIIWSYGNESGGGDNFAESRDKIKALDDTRPTHYEGNSGYADMTSTMYASLGTIEWYGNNYRGKPHIQCENTHAMGQSMGNQREYFDLYEKYPSLIGEFIWDFKDQGLLVKTNQRGTNNPYDYYWAYGGDFGDRPNDANFCCNGLVLPDLSLTGKSYNSKKIYQPVEFYTNKDNRGHYWFKNKLQQIPLSDNEIEITYDILADGIVQNSGTVNYGSIPVGESRDIDISGAVNSINMNSKPGAEWNIRFHGKLKNATKWAEAGYEVASEQLELGSTDKPNYYSNSSNALNINQSGNSITVSSNNFSAVFTDGNLSSYKVNGQETLNKPLALNTFRIPTDNDEIGKKGAAWDKAKLRNLQLTAGEMKYEKDGSGRNATIRVTNVYKGSTAATFTVQMQYTISNEGVITVNSDITPTGEGIIIPCIGFKTEMREGYDNMTWLGRGPWDNYPDRKEAALVGLYKSKVADQFSRFVRPQDCGNHEDTRWLAMRNNNGQGLLFVAPQNMSTSAMNYRPEEVHRSVTDRARHFNDINFIKENVVCLNAAVRGLGNASCGEEVLDKYELRTSHRNFNFIILPLEGNLSDDQLAEKARIKNDVQTNFQKIERSTDKTGWRIEKCDNWESAQENDGPQNLIDKNTGTIWHTNWNGSEFPHEVIVDFGQPYRVEAFIYQGRTDGIGNGRVKDFEVSFSNNPNVFGAPLAKGALEGANYEQIIDLDRPVIARYMKFTALSQQNWTNNVAQMFAAASELGIIGERYSGSVSTPQPKITNGRTYYLIDAKSRRYLHHVNENDDKKSKYALGVTVDESPNGINDENYRFTFEQVDGFNTFFYVRNGGGQYMIRSNNDWSFTTGGRGNYTTWTNVEQNLDGTIKLRAVWRGADHLYANFDGNGWNSFFYADKGDGARFYAIPVGDPIILGSTYDKNGWSIVSCDNWESTQGNDRPENVLDNDRNTLWHTNWNGSDFPHEIIIDFGQAYDVSAFVYQGRMDNQNGRVASYEVAFSNDAKVFGSPSIKGWLNNDNSEQVIELNEPVTARYMRFTALSQHAEGNTKYTSVAELAVIGDRHGSNVDAPRGRIEDGKSYYLVDAASNRFLRYAGMMTEGNYALAEDVYEKPEGVDDDNYKFTFEKVDGFSTYFYIRNAAGQYMKEGASDWSYGTGNRGNFTTWNNVEQQADGTIKLRAVWRGADHVYSNFDSHNAGSYIYCDKGDGAKFYALPVGSPINSVKGVAVHDTNDAPYYNLAGQRVKGSYVRGIVIREGKKYVK